MRHILAAMAATAALALPAAAHAACDPAPPSPAVVGKMPVWGGISSSDGVLDVWCKLQAALSGDYQVDIWFPLVDPKGGAQTHHAFPTRFDQTPAMGKDVLAKAFQALLHVDDKTPAHDAAGASFPKVWENVVRPTAVETAGPDSRPLAFPPKFGAEDQLILWTPVALRVKPIIIDGIEYKLTVSFYPTLSRWLEEVEGRAETFEMQGARKAILPTSGGCPPRVPHCERYSEPPFAGGPDLPVQTAWTAGTVKLEAQGHAMSAKMLSLVGSMAATYGPWEVANSAKDGNFDAAVGEAEYRAEDGPRTFSLTSKGDRQFRSGTNLITMLWNENPRAHDSYASVMGKWADDTRQSILLQYSAEHARQ